MGKHRPVASNPRASLRHRHREAGVRSTPSDAPFARNPAAWAVEMIKGFVKIASR